MKTTGSLGTIRSILPYKEADAAFIKNKADPFLVKAFQSSFQELNFENGWCAVVPSGVEKDYLQDKVEVLALGNFAQWGRLNEVRQNLTSFLKEYTIMSDEIMKKTIDYVERLTASFTEALGEDTAYVLLRTRQPTDTDDEGFYKLRWHEDARFFDPTVSRPYKLLIALNGRSTVMGKPTEAQYRHFKEFEQKSLDLKRAGKVEEGRELYRVKVDAFMDENVSQMWFEDCSRAIVHTYPLHPDDLASVHAEPPIDCHRIFVSVVPGPSIAKRATVKKRPRKKD